MSKRAAPSGRDGRYVESTVAGETVRAFVPGPLPPDPPIDVTRLLGRLSRAERALGRLDGISPLLPEQGLFLYMYVRKEAVLSSQIEGTQSTLTDLLRYEADAVAGSPIDDIRDVSNYVEAMTYGLERLKTLPLSLRLIREMHARLLNSGRGAAHAPGEFRRSQNLIAGTRPGNAQFVPPPVSELGECLSAFEHFMHEESGPLPPLIKAGLLHVQFETIHPFLDGNGRIGRLLVILYLVIQGALPAPLLYLSLWLKTHRTRYCELLQEVREEGDWEAWLEFFLEGVEFTAVQAFDAATRIVRLFEKDRERIRTSRARVGSLLRVHDVLQKHPCVTSPQLAAATGLTKPTVNSVLGDLTELGILREVTGKQRGRVWAYHTYLAILDEGADA
jgi:Fic family protein